MKHPSLFQRRVLTIAAIVMMVSSALLSFFLVQQNDKQIAELKRSEEKIDQNIRTLWNNASEAERNADTAVIISLLAKTDTPETLELKHYYLSRMGITQPNAAIMDVLKAANDKRSHTVDAVNDLYISQLGVQNEITAREAANKRSANFAFLLQLIALVLVILTREMHGI